MKELVKVIKRKGYEIRHEMVSGDEYGVPEDEPFLMKTAYTPEGGYIGDSKRAYRLITKRGIAPEVKRSDLRVCTIGFCEREQKWYGWSHRAICGFGIGDKLFDEFYEGADDYTPFVAHGDAVIETLEQARQAAVNFSDSVA